MQTMLHVCVVVELNGRVLNVVLVCRSWLRCCVSLAELPVVRGFVVNLVTATVAIVILVGSRIGLTNLRLTMMEALRTFSVRCRLGRGSEVRAGDRSETVMYPP